MNFSEAIPDITSSYSYNYLDPDLFLTYNDPYQECGDLLKNVNNKKINSNCSASYPGPVDVKKLSDKNGSAYTKGFDEQFTPTKQSEKRVTWAPSTVYPISNFKSSPDHKCHGKDNHSSKSIFDDHMIVFITFVFVLYLVYSLITLRIELDHIKKILNMQQYQQMMLASNIPNR